MAKKHDVIIYMSNVQLDVVIPEAHVWDFMLQFGTAFPIRDSHQGTTNIRAVDGYYNHPNGWHIQVTVHHREEGELLTFLRDFCENRNLSFREPE